MLRLFSLNERARRREYWLVLIVGLVVLLTAVGLIDSFLQTDAAASLDVPAWSLDMALLGLVVLLFWPIFATSVRRAHDRGHTGLWYAALIVVGFVFDLAFPGASTETGLPRLADDVPPPVQGASVALWLWSLVLTLPMAFLSGTRGPNRYGPSPKGEGEPAYRGFVLSGSEPAP